MGQWSSQKLLPDVPLDILIETKNEPTMESRRLLEILRQKIEQWSASKYFDWLLKIEPKSEPMMENQRLLEDVSRRSKIEHLMYSHWRLQTEPMMEDWRVLEIIEKQMPCALWLHLSGQTLQIEASSILIVTLQNLSKARFYNIHSYCLSQTIN